VVVVDDPDAVDDEVTAVVVLEDVWDVAVVVTELCEVDCTLVWEGADVTEICEVDWTLDWDVAEERTDVADVVLDAEDWDEWDAEEA
jgi:hypothetical protein